MKMLNGDLVAVLLTKGVELMVCTSPVADDAVEASLIDYKDFSLHRVPTATVFPLAAVGSPGAKERTKEIEDWARLHHDLPEQYAVKRNELISAAHG